jgi:hypothetical protein
MSHISLEVDMIGIDIHLFNIVGNQDYSSFDYSNEEDYSYVIVDFDFSFP